jgi:hypothetical protein
VSSVPSTNPLSYNQYIQQVAALAVYQTAEFAGVYAFVDAPPQLIVPMMLNYAELRIQRDLDLLSTQSSNTYALTAGQQTFSVPVNDFLSVQTAEIGQMQGGTFYQLNALTPVSKEYIQNCFGGIGKPGQPRVFAMYGDNWQDGQDTYMNLLFGPAPATPFTLRITGTSREPSLFTYSATGVADTSYTYVSTYLPDMLIVASMIYITMFQRNFNAATSDQPDMGLSYEKQYQALRLGAIAEENRRKFQASGWSPYSTPTAATPTR